MPREGSVILGEGLARANSFLTHHRGHTPGDFCYGFYTYAGHTERRRNQVPRYHRGPGVTSDVVWSDDDIGSFDPAVQDQMRALERSWRDPKCRV
jgi:hypothetical protein